MAGCLCKRPKVLVPLVLVVAAACVVVVVLARKHSQGYTPPPLAFDGKSDDLKQTVIVPTLDTPMPAGKNVVWCASFQLAWNEFRDDVIGEPVKITGAQEIADRLNASTITRDVLEPDDYYAKAGFVEAGAVEQIRAEMAARFPGTEIPDLAFSGGDIAVAFGYVRATVPFRSLFYENRRPFEFRGVRVSSFGIREKDKDMWDPARRQVFVLYTSQEEGEPWSDDCEFAVDPCMYTDPYQIILARMEPKASLAETVAELERKMKDRPAMSYRLDEEEILLVPNLHFEIEHGFKQLEGENRAILNPGHEGAWLARAWQTIYFRLDRAGAVLESKAGMAMAAEPERRAFVFDRPFLILIQKRDDAPDLSDSKLEPFFVMWVDNAELLCKP